VRNYWWRVIKGFIPCRSVLEARHIEKIKFCHECGSNEIIHHALFDCTWAKLFWQEIKAVTSVKIPQLHPNTWAIDIIDSSKVDPRDAAIILCGGWAVWSERNSRKHGESSRTISESVKWAADIASDLAISGCVVTRPAKVKSKWQLPAPGTLKVNVDAGFSSISGEGTTGLVIRNHEGVLIRGQAIWYNGAASVLSMEALAVRDGVQLASDIGLSRIEVETDASVVVMLWKDRANGRSEIAPILLEIEEITRNMEYFHLKFIGREANEGAHLCAKQASASRRRCLWINYVPVFLADCLQNDCKPDD
jgi:ribonuclease HI